MKTTLTVTTHKVFVDRSTLRAMARLAEQATRLVDRSVPGQMGTVQIVMTDERGLVELALAADVALAGEPDRHRKARALREGRQAVRDIAARAIPLPGGGALILMKRDSHPNEAAFTLTLVHELVHAMQFSRKGVLERIVRDTRASLGIERPSRPSARRNARQAEEDEREAYGREYLADRIIPGASSAAA